MAPSLHLSSSDAPSEGEAVSPPSAYYLLWVFRAAQAEVHAQGRFHTSVGCR
jgi:hypothetical protein